MITRLVNLLGSNLSVSEIAARPKCPSVQTLNHYGIYRTPILYSSLTIFRDSIVGKGWVNLKIAIHSAFVFGICIYYYEA